MTQRIRATFGDLRGLVDTIERTSAQIEQELDSLTKQLGTLAEQWTGGASDAFQQKVRQWYAAADDLRGALKRLGRILDTTTANYRSAVTTNTRMWPQR
ncbi:MAG TPA: WXG100 family type VII secretion target [Pseudonocardiaceae bacterium]